MFSDGTKSVNLFRASVCSPKSVVDEMLMVRSFNVLKCGEDCGWSIFQPPDEFLSSIALTYRFVLKSTEHCPQTARKGNCYACQANKNSSPWLPTENSRYLSKELGRPELFWLKFAETERFSRYLQLDVPEYKLGQLPVASRCGFPILFTLIYEVHIVDVATFHLFLD